MDHLRKEYRIVISGRQEVRRETTQTRLGDITAFMAHETLAPAKKRKMTPEEDALDQAIVAFILECRIASKVRYFTTENAAT